MAGGYQDFDKTFDKNIQASNANFSIHFSIEEFPF
jgi:hypothetical protein